MVKPELAPVPSSGSMELLQVVLRALAFKHDDQNAAKRVSVSRRYSLVSRAVGSHYCGGANANRFESKRIRVSQAGLRSLAVSAALRSLLGLRKGDWRMMACTTFLTSGKCLSLRELDVSATPVAPTRTAGERASRSPRRRRECQGRQESRPRYFASRGQTSTLPALTERQQQRRDSAEEPCGKHRASHG